MTDREENGQFKRGRSGNPKGRPTLQTTAIRKQLALNYKEVLQVIRKAALCGDMQACKMILDRICPPLKPQATPITMNLPPESNMTQIAEAILRACSDGSIPPDIGAQMVAAIGHCARINAHFPKEEEEVLIDKIQIQVIDDEGNITHLN